MKKYILTLVCIFICFAVNSTLAQNSLTPNTPNISPDSYIEAPEYSAEYVSNLLERVVELEILAASLETRIVELERYLNAYTSPSTVSTTTTEQPTAQQTTTQQTTTSSQQTDSTTSASSSPNADSYSYYLQVGAYQRSDLGFQQKQKLEQYGYAVQESENENIYRLYIGPFPNAEIEGIQGQLRELGIESFPIR